MHAPAVARLDEVDRDEHIVVCLECNTFATALDGRVVAAFSQKCHECGAHLDASSALSVAPDRFGEVAGRLGRAAARATARWSP